jgi:hypothetical protein
MVQKISKPEDCEKLTRLAEEIGGFYIKVVIDIKNEILVAGAKMHVDEEKILLDQGSSQQDVWGGGYDLETKQITFDSIINNKPGINSSSDILDPEVRSKFMVIIKNLLKL